MRMFPRPSRRSNEFRGVSHSNRCNSSVPGFLFLFAIWTLVGAAISLSKGDEPFKFRFTNVARKAGLNTVTVYGGKETNRYLLETTGCGVAFLDYNNDDLLDIFQVNGSVLEGFPKGSEPTNHLYLNQGDGTFQDVTERAKLAHSGWGQGVCTGDYDNDGYVDLFVSYWGKDQLYRNRGDGTFENFTREANILGSKDRWGTGCAFLDFDRDGYLDLFVANYIDFDVELAPDSKLGLCNYKGIQVACGPAGLPGGKNILYRNRGNGTFEDVSERSKIINAIGTYGLGVSTLDFDNDGWIDIYVANDSNPSALYHNNRDGTFTDIGVRAGCSYSQDGNAQAGMGVAVGDYDRNGFVDIFKTNFSGDTSTLYSNLGAGLCEDMTFSAGIGVNTRWLGWGAGFLDLDNDGWLDLFLSNGHVYPEVSQLQTEAGYKQRKVVYRNRGGRRFEDISEKLGPPITTPKASRGSAFGDFNNDGGVDIVVSNVHDTPDLLRLDNPHPGNHWIMVRLVGTRSNRSAIGARVRCVVQGSIQTEEVRGGGSYLSQNDLRVHFGLGEASLIDRLEVRWPNGLEEEWTRVHANRIVTLKEGSGRPFKESK